MPSSRDIQNRIKSVKNTAQITKAMEVVSATKMRRSQDVALKGRPYALAALDMLRNVKRRTPEFSPHIAPGTVAVVVTSDKGLAGAYNANVLRRAERFLKSAEGIEVVTVGKKSREFFSSRGYTVSASFTGFGDYVEAAETKPLTDLLWGRYEEGEIGTVVVFYTNFRSTLRQLAREITLLPLKSETIVDTIRSITPEYGRYAGTEPILDIEKYNYEYTFEPSIASVLTTLEPMLFEIQMHHLVLESNASEHSARMVAMKSASDNAKELMGDLGILYNKARQGGITKELTEIAAGTEALEAA